MKGGGRLCRRTLAAPPPETFFGALAGRPGAFLLDSAARGVGLDPDHCRWSFFGCDPVVVLRSDAGGSACRDASGQRVRWHVPSSPWAALRAVLAELAGDSTPGRAGEPGLPPFTSGAVGFLGYDLKHGLERLPEPPSVRDTDDLWLGLHDAIGAFDHAEGTLTLLSRGLAGGGSDAAAARALDALERRIVEAWEALAARPPEPPAPAAPAAPEARWRASVTRAEYEDTVSTVRRLIGSGEIYQANYSQRFEIASPGPAWPIHARLRSASAAPWAAFLSCDGLEILSASPELFLRRRGDRVETRPIKGTRPRGATPEDDARLAAELAASEKDRAELVMIVDVERNDLGKVCRTGTVEVPELFRLESWAQVHHLVATVRGRLKPEVTAVDLVAAAFPGGSITGAPKIRAMEILDRLEPVRRGPWTGAAGWFDAGGDLDLHVAIRTIYRAGGRARVQAGGGITWPSDPATEFDETITKARALAEAVAPGVPFPAPEEPAG